MDGTFGNVNLAVNNGVLNSNQRGTGREKTAGDLGEWVPWVPLGFPSYKRSIVCRKTIL